VEQVIAPGQYKRGFTWRLSNTQKEFLGAPSKALARLSRSDYSDLLVDFLTISRNRQRNWLSLMKLQLWMIEEIAYNEKGVKHYKGQLEKLEQQLASSTSPNEKAELAKGKEQLESEVFFHRLYANALRAIGDGIAWRAFDFDRAVMRSLSQRATNQTLLAEGTAQELRQWSKTFDGGSGLPILNAITNVLSLGDVTVVHDDGSGEIIEVKTGTTKSGRITRQKQQMRETVKLLKEGKGQLEDTTIEILKLDIYPENNLATLYGQLEQASQSGWSGGKVDEYCYLECFDIRQLKGDTSQITERLAGIRKREIGDWESNNDFVLTTSSLDILSFTPNCAPFSVFPFPPTMCIGLLTGTLSYTSYYNLSALCRILQNLNWKVTKGPDQLTSENITRDASILDVEKDGFYSRMPPAELMRMQMELIRNAVFIGEMDMIKNMGPGAAPDAGFVVFTQENAIWS
jgi:hypothetical protein